MEPKKLFLLDAYALIFRAYYALIKSPRYTSDGLNTSAIFGFVNTLEDIIKKENPTHIAVCFDPPGPTFRHEAYEEYKAGREETPEDIKKAVPFVKDIIRAYNIPIIEVPGYEADDVIASMAVLAEKNGFETYMMTPDKDFGQLVTDHIRIYRPAYRGGEFEIRGVKEICERYSLEDPIQVIDLLALMGDKVDNIPGCPGVGEVTAIKLLKQFGSVENLIANTDQLKGALKTKVENNKESITFSKFLATIKTDAPVTFDEKALMREDVNMEELRSIFERLEFRTLLKRILDRTNQTAAPVEAAPKPAAQPSLFDFGGGEPEQTVAPSVETPATALSIEVIAEKDKIADAAKKYAAEKEFGFSVVVEGEEAMTAKIIGFAFVNAEAKAVYVPYSKENIQLLAPVFESEAEKVGCNIKFDTILLRREGIELRKPYFDTEVAHYILQPEQNHGYASLADIYLGREAVAVTSVFVKKGKGFLLMEGATDEMLANFACDMADIVLKLKPVLTKHVEELEMLPLLNDIELPLIEVLADMEYTGVRIDTEVLNNYSKVLTEQMNIIEKECYELAGEEFNISSPMQVGEILFEKLKIDEKAKKTRTGQYSTTEEILVKLEHKHPIVSKILAMRSVRKLLSTYVNALPELINPETGRIHTTFNQTVTATGRLSSTNPNIQNIPVREEEGREIRKAFIPSDGNRFFSADYSQIELRLVADISKDHAMVDAFLSGEDIHRATAAKIYHEDPKNVTADQRRHAKTANFGILYGVSAFGLSERLHISRGEAKSLIEGYMRAFPGVQEYITQSVEDAKNAGYVSTRFGRRRMLPDINSRNAIVRGFSERNAVNAPIQGTAADIIKIAMVRIFQKFKEEGLKTKMTLQVHDELNFDMVPEEEEKVTAIVIDTMRSAYKGLVPLDVSYSVGNNWLEAH